LLPDETGRSYAGYRVELRQYPDGRLEVLHKGSVIKTQEAPAKARLFHPGGAKPATGVDPMPAWLQEILAHEHGSDLKRISHRRPSEPRRPTPRQQARWDAVQEGKRRGFSEHAIAISLGISRNTVSKYARAISPPINCFGTLARVSGTRLSDQPP